MLVQSVLFLFLEQHVPTDSKVWCGLLLPVSWLSGNFPDVSGLNMFEFGEGASRTIRATLSRKIRRIEPLYVGNLYGYQRKPVGINEGVML